MLLVKGQLIKENLSIMEETNSMTTSNQEPNVKPQELENTESTNIEVKVETTEPDVQETIADEPEAQEVKEDVLEVTEEVLEVKEEILEVKEVQEVEPVSEVKEVPADSEKKAEPTNIDYNKLSLEALVAETNNVVNTYEFGKSKKIIDIIKNTFYSKLNKEQEEHREKYLADGGKAEDYLLAPSAYEETFKELIKVFKTKRAEAVASLENEKQANFKIKVEIVEEITLLVNSTEHFNTVYNKFKDLQEKWKSIKQIPATKTKELNSKYQFALNQFYDYLQINKELRELDLKKNQEQKEALCARAESLINSKNAKTAFVELQDLHQRWKDVGPVIEEHREELWERFKNATKDINDKFQDYQNKLKEGREDNLIKKKEICEKVDVVIEQSYTTPKEWDKGSEAIVELQKEWRKIGMVPTKFNEEVYNKFKSSCDQFFQQKNEFFKGLKSKQKDNLNLKMELVEKVEALIENQEWSETTNKIIQIQKEWKNVGPVPRKKSDVVWKRFRAACDQFFNNKDAHFKDIHGDEKENLEAKKTLITEIETYIQKEDGKISIEDLKAFQDRWANIGFVPIKHKNDIQDAYRTAINNQFDALNIDAKEKDLARLKVKMEQYIESPNAEKLIFGERNKLVLRIKKFETDIQQLENNIGFFSSGTAKGLLKEYENKIEMNKKSLEALKSKMRLIDKYIE